LCKSIKKDSEKDEFYPINLFKILNYRFIFFVNTKGRRQINAIEYMSPIKVSGGISASPIFIITNKVDQRKVMRSASKMAFKCE